MKKPRSKLGKTKLEAEKASRRARGELEERLDAVGQESEEKAVKWVIEENQERDKQKQKEFEDTLHFFIAKRKTIKGYYEALARLTDNLLKGYIDWGGKWLYRATYNNARGVGVIIQDPDGNTFARGFKPNGEPKYDLHAVKVLILQTENIVDAYQEQKRTHQADPGK